MIKILFISHSSELGGAENNLLKLLSGMPKEEFECHCIFPRNGILKKKAELFGVKTYISDLNWWVMSKLGTGIDFFNICGGIKNRVQNIVQIIKNNQIDLVMTNTIVIGDGAVAAKIAGVPHVWRIAELLSIDPALRSPVTLKDLYESVLFLSDNVVAVAEAVKLEIERIIGYASSKIKVIYDGIDEPNTIFDFPRNHEKIVFSAGVISRRKGFMTLLQSAQHVCKVIPNVKFVIAGAISEKDYYNELMRERKRLGLEDIINYIGFQHDIYSLMKNSSLFVLPSLSEPFGTVIIEAMIAGKPVVATDSGGPCEAVEDGVTGFIVPVNNAEDMGAKIVTLLNNPKKAEEMGHAGYLRAKKVFNVSQFINNFSAIFKSSAVKKTISHDQSNSLFTRIIDNCDYLAKDYKKINYLNNLYNRITKSNKYKLYKKFVFIKNIIKKILLA